MGLQHQK